MNKRQIRAIFNQDTIRVYQAFNSGIADAAIKKGTFSSPPFSLTRMTWIKPSFLWMMYRCGWAQKDVGQQRVLAIDITREGFEYALSHSCLSHFDAEHHQSHDEWNQQLKNSPIRIQWDPERDIYSKPQDHRSLQIGISGAMVEKYVNEWIVAISDITSQVKQMKKLLDAGKEDELLQQLPQEAVYPLPQKIQKIISMDN